MHAEKTKKSIEEAKVKQISLCFYLIWYIILKEFIAFDNKNWFILFAERFVHKCYTDTKNKWPFPGA